MEAFKKSKYRHFSTEPQSFHIEENNTSHQKRVSSLYCISEDMLHYNGIRPTFISKV